MVLALVSYYLGGVTVALFTEQMGDGIQVSDVLAAATWPLSTIAYVVEYIKGWRAGV